MSKMAIFKLSMLLVIFLSAIFSSYTLVKAENRGILTISFLNIGQGDSIFIDSPSHKQMIVDGGPGRTVLRELGEVMPFYDKTIDVAIATHPDADHISGLNDVFLNYKVDIFFEPGIESDTAVYKHLENIVNEKIEIGTIKKIEARRGMIIDFGDGAFFQIFYPDHDPRGEETNDASIVGRLVYGENEFLLTGDSPEKIEKYLISLHTPLESDVLKPGHHGSRTSTSEQFVEVVSPEYAVISAGLNNRYGHPHEEVIDILEKAGVSVFRTDLQGRITFQSDGQNLTFQP